MFGVASLSADWFTSLAPAITENIAVLVPVGLTIMAVMIGLSLIPKVIRKLGRV